MKTLKLLRKVMDLFVDILINGNAETYGLSVVS